MDDEGGLGALERLDLCRARIARLDQAGPRLNAVLEWNLEAEEMAAALDAGRPGARLLGSLGAEPGEVAPLRGLPVLVKDNIDTGDSMHGSAGALALADRFAREDSAVAARLREAGAVIVGKANMTELANFMTEGMPNGYSSRGGQVRHAWKPGLDPSGSSTGSAAAVAAGYVSLAIGTETCGSIIGPASAAGIVGLKPSVGLVSRRGIVPIAPSQDTAGPMARSVRDCAVAISFLAGFDPADPATSACLGRSLPGPTDCLRYRAGLGGLRLGVALKDEKGKDIDTPAFRAALKAAESLGARLVPVTLPPFAEEDMLSILVNEFRPAMDAFLRSSAGKAKSLADIARYNADRPESCLRYGQSWIDKALALPRPMLNEAYVEAKRRARAARAALAALFEAQGLGAVASPEGLMLFPVAACPSLCLPVGLDAETGAPRPLVLNGLPFSEGELLGIGSALEDAIGWDKAPEY